MKFEVYPEPVRHRCALSYHGLLLWSIYQSFLFLAEDFSNLSLTPPQLSIPLAFKSASSGSF